MKNSKLKDLRATNNKHGNPVFYFMGEKGYYIGGTAHYKDKKQFSIFLNRLDDDVFFQEIKVDCDFDFPVGLLHYSKGEYHILVVEGFDELFVD